MILVLNSSLLAARPELAARVAIEQDERADGLVLSCGWCRRLFLHQLGESCPWCDGDIILGQEVS